MLRRNILKSVILKNHYRTIFTSSNFTGSFDNAKTHSSKVYEDAKNHSTKIFEDVKTHASTMSEDSIKSVVSSGTNQAIVALNAIEEQLKSMNNESISTSVTFNVGILQITFTQMNKKQ